MTTRDFEFAVTGDATEEQIVALVNAVLVEAEKQETIVSINFP